MNIQLKIKVIIVDDHLIVRDGIKSILQKENDIDVIGESSNYSELLDLLKIQIPDIILMDISLPDLSGIEITKRIRETNSDIGIIMLSMHISEEFVFNSINAGANGYLPKNTSRKDLLKAIKTVHEGNEFFDPNISKIMMKGFVNLAKQDARESSFEDLLSSREIEILKLFVNGSSNKEIADKLFISIRTVESHKNHIMQKLELKSPVEMVKFALKHNITDL